MSAVLPREERDAIRARAEGEGRGVSEPIDWATTDGCPRCWEHGPYLPPGLLYDDERARTAHQAWHEMVAALLGPVARLLRREGDA